MSSHEYWESRYLNGGTSGEGSYGEPAQFKAMFLNSFVRQHRITEIIEFGCGDGNQLSLAKYPNYVGFDVSREAIALCKKRFRSDPTKSFRLMRKYRGERADLALSLDVIYHLLEDDVFEIYMQRLFDSSRRFVVIYSSNTDDNSTNPAPHVRHRNFSNWVKKHRPLWDMVEQAPNPLTTDRSKSVLDYPDFFVYRWP